MACVATVHKPSSVSNAISANFFSETEPCLILSKSNRLEFYKILENGLSLSHELTTVGRVTALLPYRPIGATREHVLIATDLMNYFTLCWNGQEIEGDVALQSLHDNSLRSAECGTISMIDPGERAICLYLYQGVLTVIPLAPKKKSRMTGPMGEPYSSRIFELNVIAAVMLYECAEPTVAILFKDGHGRKHVTSYSLNLKDKELDTAGFKAKSVDAGASHLIAVHSGGFIVVGEQAISFHPPGKDAIREMTSPSIWNTYAQMTSNSWLIGDDYGNIVTMTLENEKLQVKKAYTGNVPTCLVPLPEDHIFIGSHYGDSQLVHLGSQSVRQTFPNLGPISDFLVSRDPLGSSTIVTCSGAYANGSLRVVRHGVSMEDPIILSDLGTGSGFNGLFSICDIDNSRSSNVLVVSLLAETHFLLMNGGVEDTQNYLGLTSDEPTIAIGNHQNKVVSQVTPNSVRLASQQLKTSKHIACKCINAATNKKFVLVASTEGAVHLYDFSLGEIKFVQSRTFGSEIASLDLVPDLDKGVIGLWDGTVHVVDLPSLANTCAEHRFDQIPRSVLLTGMESIDVPMLFIAMEDGSMSICSVSNEISFERTITMGTRPVKLGRYGARGNNSLVFVSSDRPSIVFGKGGKVGYFSVNSRDCYSMTQFENDEVETSLALATEEGLQLGNIDTASKLHIETVPIGELPKRIVHQVATRSYGILTMKLVVDPTTGHEEQQCFFRVFDSFSFEVITSMPLDQNEFVLSLTTYMGLFVIGTGYTFPEEDECTKGRILFVQYIPETKALNRVHVIDVKGAVYCLDSKNQLLVAGINSHVVVIQSGSDESDESENIKTFAADTTSMVRVPTIALCLSIFDESLILAGDLMKSVMVIDSTGGSYAPLMLSKDYGSLWTAAIAVLDQNRFFVAEAEGNLGVLQWSPKSMIEEERERLQWVSKLRWGEMVNKVIPASLLSEEAKASNPNIQPEGLFVTVDGSIVSIAKITNDVDKLVQLQINASHAIKGPGGADILEWRGFSNKRVQEQEPYRFIDGEFLEQLMDVPAEELEAIIRASAGGDEIPDFQASDAYRLIEQISRIH